MENYGIRMENLGFQAAERILVNPDLIPGPIGKGPSGLATVPPT